MKNNSLILSEHETFKFKTEAMVDWLWVLTYYAMETQNYGQCC
jgi:hypothetical protein